MSSTFYCTRCGTCLELERGANPADGYVRCEHCAGLTRVPADAANDGVPVARVAGSVACPPTPVLPYASARSDRLGRSARLEEVAERLRRVTDEPTDDGGGMTECRYCGSTIAPFVRTCPYCRNALWGV